MLRRLPFVVQLRAGEGFTDQVVDVVTEGGDDFAVFRAHPRAWPWGTSPPWSRSRAPRSEHAPQG